ncbi:unnamed protein product (macronuclear) [Paramecium tetraurelia]|uniref:Uncharacterized protein n=1 Tax=Paramecium tetraurelia TaxID=5888 RepID=A0BRJ3_PARTE|nr:uncharacterized protein GSPATT00031391001 [Paramecium tetraurelia]CAK61160.1 unnamed protein product [Paramecium tetraurelia]|eukprot:XP_001428558.1 hypothetical protein (macronuclear) [Paramecium tetraurelia strain d4-2]
MKHSISFLKILFLRSILYQNCITDKENDCKSQDFQIAGTIESNTGICGSGSRKTFIGPFGNKTLVTYDLPYLIPNKNVELSFGIWKLDSWDNEGFEIWINNVLMEKLVAGNYDYPDVCRDPQWGDHLYYFSYQFQLTNTHFTLELKDFLDQELIDESWGLRDFVLSLSSLCVNFYSECNYSGELFQICKGDKTTRSTSLPYEIKSIMMDCGIIVKIKDPNQFGGALQEYSSPQPCIGGYKVFIQESTLVPKIYSIMINKDINTYNILISNFFTLWIQSLIHLIYKIKQNQLDQSPAFLVQGQGLTIFGLLQIIVLKNNGSQKSYPLDQFFLSLKNNLSYSFDKVFQNNKEFKIIQRKVDERKGSNNLKILQLIEYEVFSVINLPHVQQKKQQILWRQAYNKGKFMAGNTKINSYQQEILKILKFKTLKNNQKVNINIYFYQIQLVNSNYKFNFFHSFSIIRTINNISPQEIFDKSNLYGWHDQQAALQNHQSSLAVIKFKLCLYQQSLSRWILEKQTFKSCLI